MGLVSGARAAASAAYESGMAEICDTNVDDPTWTAEDDSAFHDHLLLNPSALLDDPRRGRTAAIEALEELEARRCRIVAEQHRVMLSLAGERPRSRDVTVWDEDDEPRSVVLTDETVELVAVLLRRSPDSVRRQLVTARTLARLPRTVAAVEAGLLGIDHAEQVARVAHELPEHLREGFERTVLRRLLEPGSSVTPGEAGSLARRVRARLDAVGEEARRARARRHEDVRIWAESDGLACLQARLPLADAARVHAALDARARLQPFDPDHSVGMRRAAALVEAVCGSADGEAAAGIAVHVTIDLPTLLGLADEPALVDMPAGCPEPITADALRELLSDPRVPATLRRMVVDPVTGHLLDRGRSSYRVPESLRAFLVARDGTCRFAGCPRRADRCDVDHVTAWVDGGGTDRANTIPLCRRHHLQKTFGEWSVRELRDDGTVVWRAPDGRSIVTRPWRSQSPMPPPEPPPRTPRAPN